MQRMTIDVNQKLEVHEDSVISRLPMC